MKTTDNEALFRRIGGKNGSIGYDIASCLYRKGIDIYCEPFGGSFGVGRQAAPFPIEIWNDLDNVLYTFMKSYCIYGNTVFERLLETMEYSQSHFDYVKLIANYGQVLEDEIRYHKSGTEAETYKIADDIQKAVYAWELIEQSFNGNTKQWAGIKKGNEEVVYENRMVKKEGLFERFKNVLPINMDALELIRKLQGRQEVMLYIDSPYAFSDDDQSLDSTRRTTKGLYKHDMDNDGQEALAKLVLPSKAKVMLSGYRNKIYDSILNASNDWFSYDIAEVCKSSAVCATGGTKPRAIETIWTNYPL
jgi:site-specific DNA-adenine methylase